MSITLKGFIALQFIGVKDAKQDQDNLIKHILYNDTAYIQDRSKQKIGVCEEAPHSLAKSR